MKKRILAALLSAAMVIGMLSEVPLEEMIKMQKTETK